MENKDFETILIVKEFEKCCSFYQGLIDKLKICVASNFMMKFLLPCGRILKICAADPLDANSVPMPVVINLQMKNSSISSALNFLLQHDYSFTAGDKTVRVADPAGNILLISASDECSIKTISASQKTQKIDIS